MYDDMQIENEGQTLNDAFDRIRMEHSLWPEYGAIKTDQALPSAAAYLAHVRTGFIISESDDPQRSTTGGISNHQIKLRERVDEINKIFVKLLLTQLTAGEIIGFGRKGSCLDHYERIPATAWRYIKVSYGDSTAKQRGKNGSVLFDIRVFKKGDEPQPDGAKQQRVVVEPHEIKLRGKSFYDIWTELEEKYPDEFEKFYGGKLVDTTFANFLGEKCGGVYKSSYFRREFGNMRKAHQKKK